MAARIAHYELLERISEGGMGVVYRARDTKLDRLVALKFLSRDIGSCDEDVAAFLHEARAISRLSHPNIATIYAVEEDEGDRFLAFEYLPGGTLADVIRAAREPLALSQIVRWGAHIVRALAHAHRHGIVHRDVKSANVLLTADGHAKLTDFGVAQVAGRRDGSTGETVGTAAYMSPEQVQGLPIDKRSDLFSVGAVLFEMAVGRPPFHDVNQSVIFYDVVHTPAPPVSTLRPHTPARFDSIVARLLEKDPERRYQTADDLLADIESLRSEPTSGLGRTQSAPDATVAVLPFVDMSPERDQEYFCDGMTEEIIAALSEIKGLKVVSRTSSFEFKNRAYDIREIGSQLSVDTVLEGSVRKAGDRVRIAVQHIKVADGFHLWSDRYERSLEDIFAIQEEIAEAIAGNLRCKLLAQQDAPPARRKAAVNLDAYNSYLAGRYHINQRGKQAVLKAMECFREAVRADQAYAPAWSGLAEAYVLSAARSMFEADPAESLVEADKAARRAIELDGGSPEAHVALALVKMRKDWDWAGANAEFERAIELNENHAPAHHQYAMCLAFQNRLDEALEHIGRAREL
ncbi:MAG: protein kinase, partial [Acidobacteria bacterium]|nr:protein kinase [Acidobacteriota bacterium]